MGKKIGLTTSGLPGPRSWELMESRNQNISRGISYFLPVFVKETRGALLEDLDGNIFIDFAGGIGVANFGHNHPAVIKAIQEQAGPRNRLWRRLKPLPPGALTRA